MPTDANSCKVLLHTSNVIQLEKKLVNVNEDIKSISNPNFSDEMELSNEPHTIEFTEPNTSSHNTLKPTNPLVN